MRRGTVLEPTARRKYCDEMQEDHQNFQAKEIGYMVSSGLPYLGASPDGLVQCDFCGKGIVELKTTIKDSNDIPNDQMFQIQQTMLVVAKLCDLRNIYCDYVIYREDAPLHVQRVYPNQDIQDEIVQEGKHRFIHIILPELLASSLKHLVGPLGSARLVCYCQRPATCPLAQCQHSDCIFTFFHIACVGLTRNRNWATSKWFCPDCAQRNPSGK